MLLGLETGEEELVPFVLVGQSVESQVGGQSEFVVALCKVCVAVRKIVYCFFKVSEIIIGCVKLYLVVEAVGGACSLCAYWTIG